MVLIAGMLGLPACAPVGPTQAGPIPPGNASQTAVVVGVPLPVFTYRPTECQPRLLLIVFHGIERDAAAYRDHARPLADAACAVVVAPEFDRARFPQDLYQYGGVASEPAGRRTVDLVAPLAAWAQGAAGGGLPYVLLGHSAGSQFLDRVAAFTDTKAAAVILANPSTWVMPSTGTPPPFGFGRDGTAMMRAYLARPVAVLLGTADTGMKDLTMSPEAMAQGPNRHARGLNATAQAKEVAAQNGWRLGWTVAEVPGVGHNATRMFASPQALAAVRAAVP